MGPWIGARLERFVPAAKPARSSVVDARIYIQSTNPHTLMLERTALLRGNRLYFEREDDAVERIVRRTAMY